MYRPQRMNQHLQINTIDPPAGIAGGEVAVEYDPVERDISRNLTLCFNGLDAHFTAMGRRRALVIIPEIDTEGPVPVSGRAAEEAISATATFIAGKLLAAGIH